MSARAKGGATSARGFTKPPLLRARITSARAVFVIIVAMAWIWATAGRLHLSAVIIPPIILAFIVFATIYHVAMSHWVTLWWTWLRRRRAMRITPAVAAHDVRIDDVSIGVVAENEALITLVELHGDPLAPTVVTDTEERTVNVLSVANIADVITKVHDAHVISADIVSAGHRAAGGFADLYQQMTGPTPGPAQRRSWIVLRIGLHDNLAAIDRRGGDASAAERLAAVTCLRVADTLASAGIDARPATAAAIDSVNTLLASEAPGVDHWSHLESKNSYTGVYFADPAHIADDAAQWWTWPQSVSVTTLVRLTLSARGETPQIAALVRYRTEARPPAPPVSRLGPLYGVQAMMWQQFRVGYLPHAARIPSTSLASTDPVLAFGPAGPLIGSIGDPRDHTSVHLPLAGSVTVLCQSPLLLRQVALRACVTGRPLVVVTNDPRPWQSIVALAVSGELLRAFPAAWYSAEDSADGDEDEGNAALEPIAQDAVLVIDTDQDWPRQLPKVTVLTDDEACDADIELIDTDHEFGFTFKIRTGLSARVRSMPAHEERRILGMGTAGTGPSGSGGRPLPPRDGRPAVPRELPPMGRPGRPQMPPMRPPGGSPAPRRADHTEYFRPPHGAPPDYRPPVRPARGTPAGPNNPRPYPPPQQQPYDVPARPGREPLRRQGPESWSMPPRPAPPRPLAPPVRPAPRATDQPGPPRVVGPDVQAPGPEIAPEPRRDERKGPGSD